MAEPLIIVDVQRCFLSQFTHHIPARIAELVRRGGYDPLLFTRFVNTPGSSSSMGKSWLAPAAAGTPRSPTGWHYRHLCSSRRRLLPP